MIESVERSNIIPSTLKNEDPSYRRLQEIELHFVSGSISTSSGPCCSLIDLSSSTLIKTPRPNPITPCGRINSIKQYRSSISMMKSDNLVASPVDKICLEQYFEYPILISYKGVFQAKESPVRQHKRIVSKRKKRNSQFKITSTYNPFSGALVLPTFEIVIQAEVTNSHWYCDHHALSSSKVDRTLGVPHCVLSHDCAQELHESKLTLPGISGSREVIKLNISSPENHLKKNDITVESTVK
jgi:hypothetical protein